MELNGNPMWPHRAQLAHGIRSMFPLLKDFTQAGPGQKKIWMLERYKEFSTWRSAFIKFFKTCSKVVTQHDYGITAWISLKQFKAQQRPTPRSGAWPAWIEFHE